MGRHNFVVFIPLFLNAYVQASEYGRIVLSRNPRTPVLSSLKGYIDRAVNQRAQFVEMKGDMEVGIGFYLIIVWFFGWSNVFIIFFYWQFLRMKYVINYGTRATFAKIRLFVDRKLAAPGVPAVAKTLWTKVKSACEWVVKLDQPPQPGAAGAQQQQQQSRCNIF